MARAENLSDRDFSRRNFLKMGLGIGAVVLGANTHDSGNIESGELNLKQFRNIEIGSSFSPERLSWHQTDGKLELSLANYQTPEGQKLMAESLTALDLFHKELGINNIRLGIRWDNIADGSENFDFNMYKPFLDYCIANEIDITLNIGMKVFGWPEEHFPEKYNNDSLHTQAVLTSETPIIKDYIPWANKIFGYLADAYTPKELSRITTIQPENEPYNPFGENKLTVCDDYLIELAVLAQKYLPGSKILINSAELNDIDRIYALFQTLSNFVDRDRLILGINYYPFIPGNFIDPIDLYNLESIVEKKTQLGDFVKQGFKISVSEVGIEPWSAKDPPMGLRDVEKALANSRSKILTTDQPSEIDLWGMEYFYAAEPNISSPVYNLLRRIKTSKQGDS